MYLYICTTMCFKNAVINKQEPLTYPQRSLKEFIMQKNCQKYTSTPLPFLCLYSSQSSNINRDFDILIPVSLEVLLVIFFM